METSALYTVGGTIPADRGLYITRTADEALEQLCLKGEFAYVLTARQMGKSSLMVKVAERIKRSNVISVIVDLSKLGTKITAEQWYYTLVYTIAKELQLIFEPREWWRVQESLTPSSRLLTFLESVVLTQVTGSIVIFVDEIDTTLSLSFADDFYAAIRAIYNARAQNPLYQRISFVLLGVATPSSLIKDPNRTPFNIGHRVELTDFSLADAIPLSDGFHFTEEHKREVIAWIIKWTNGHPYLTQRICQHIARSSETTWTEQRIDAVVKELFFGEHSDTDTNLSFVRDMLTKRMPEGINPYEVLVVYRQIRSSLRNVYDEEQSLVKNHLKLSGIVSRQATSSIRGLLVVRNAIYSEVFNIRWVADIIYEVSPPAESRDYYEIVSYQEESGLELWQSFIRIFRPTRREIIHLPEVSIPSTQISAATPTLTIEEFDINSNSIVRDEFVDRFTARLTVKVDDYPSEVTIEVSRNEVYDELLHKRAKLLPKLHLPYIPKILSLPNTSNTFVGTAQYGVNGTRPYLILEHVEGISLQESSRHQRFSFNELMDMLEPIAITLDGLHHAGYAHLKLTPKAIVRSETGVLLTDLDYLEPIGMQLSNDHLYTPYDAPELFRDKEAQPTADIYSFGLLALCFLLNTTPDELSPSDTPSKTKASRNQIINTLSEPLQALVVSLTNEQPDQRPTSIMQSWSQLKAAYNSYRVMRFRLNALFVYQQAIRAIARLFRPAAWAILVISGFILGLIIIWWVLDYFIPFIQRVLIAVNEANLILTIVVFGFISLVAAVGILLLPRQSGYRPQEEWIKRQVSRKTTLGLGQIRFSPPYAARQAGKLRENNSTLVTGDVPLTIITPTGTLREVDMPADVSIYELIPELVSALELPVTGPDGSVLKWMLTDKDEMITIDPTLTLSQAGVVTNDTLSLVASTAYTMPNSIPPIGRVRYSTTVYSGDIPLSLVTPTHKIREVDMPANILLSDLMPELISALDLPTQGPNGEIVSYFLVDATGTTTLDTNSTLSNTGVAPGDTLIIMASTAVIEPPRELRVTPPHIRRIRADWAELTQLQTLNRETIQFRRLNEQRVEIVFIVKGIIGTLDDEPEYSNSHAVQLYLPEQYPLRAPGLKWVTQIWHPNIDHRTKNVVVTPPWTADRSLADLVLELGRMVTYQHLYFDATRQPYPLDHEAAQWVNRYLQEQGLTTFPAVDSVNFVVLPQPSAEVFCIYCRSEVLPQEVYVQCPECNSYMHSDCWDEHGSCANHNCSSHR